MSKREARRYAEEFRRRVRQMILAGYTNARIARETGETLVHVNLIAGQERAELLEAEDGRG